MAADITRLEPVAEDIWILSGETVSFHGIPFTTRSVVIRLPEGGLWVHSPVLPVPSLDGPLCELGPVKYLIAPNKIHSMGIKPWQEHWPEAQTWVSPRFNERHPDIPATRALSGAPPAPWSGVIDQHVFAGNSLLDEVVFLHKPSRTLIVTDLIQKHVADEPWYWRLLKRAAGIRGEKGGTARDIRACFRDREAARASRDHILGWDFDTLLLSHGLCLYSGARPEVVRALSWLGASE